MRNPQVEGSGACVCDHRWALGGEKCTGHKPEWGFMGPCSGKKANLIHKRSDRSEQSAAHGSFSLRWGVQRVVFLMQNAMG